MVTMDSKRSKLGWYWNRLRCMSAPEVSHRVQRKLLAGLQRCGSFTASRVPEPAVRTTESWLHRITPASREAYCSAAEKILGGSLRILSLGDVSIGSVPRWNRNPRSGHDAPLSFGKSIDYRDQSLVGDIKYLWVFNRHLHLVTLAQAHSLTGDPRFLHGIREHLRSWMEQCLYLRGPNWTSSSELAIRLINWSAVWHLVGGISSDLFQGSEGYKFQRQWLDSIYRHGHFIRGSLSRFSSANNHLLGEAAGLFVATVTWPFWKDFAEWQAVARKELIRELELQNAPDGVNREQSVFYHRFVLEYAFIAALAGKANAVELPEGYWRRLESMLEFLSAITDVAGNVPMIGDADNCSVVALSQEPDFCPYRSLLGLGAVLFRRPAFKAKAGKIDDAVLWLQGESGRQTFSEVVACGESLPVRREFPEGGYFVLGSDFETDREVRIVADAGPMGYLSLAAHGHADALAFTLFVAGREILIDPGTYAYQSKKMWRDYFRGTSAHNTIRVDRQDQSISGGNLMWLKHARVTREAWETSSSRDRLVASQHGYTRLRDPVDHRRELVFLKGERRLSIRDTLTCLRCHSIEMFWHFSERCKVGMEGSNVVAENGSITVVLSPPADFGDVKLLEGSESPVAGWVSREFDVKVPATTAVCRGEIEGTASLLTEISIDRR